MEDSAGSNNGGGGGPTIKIKVFHGSNQHDLAIPSLATFGDLKRVIAQETGLDPKVQNLLFRGKGKEDHEYLHMAGLKDNAKLIVMEKEDSAGKEENLEEVKESSEVSSGHVAVAQVREENDKLAEQVAALETGVSAGTQVGEKDIVFLTEMLMRQLLKLDGIDAEGEGKQQRKVEVRRVQSLVETMDNLKARNSIVASINGNAVPAAAQSESDLGSVNGEPSVPSSTKVTQEWEVFE